MTWFIRITLEEWRSLGGLGNPDLRRSLDAWGNWKYFRKGE